MNLPGQDTLTALSPERADRLRRLYEEELVRRCNESRPEARLWGGADDLEPGEKAIKGKGVAWQDFRCFNLNPNPPPPPNPFLPTKMGVPELPPVLFWTRDLALR